MQRNILNKGFLQNFTALIIAVLLIVGASIMNLSRPEPLFAASCSVFNGDQSSCETTSGCTWSGSCSIYNGDSNACQAASGSGCSYPGNTGDCSIFSDTSSCNAQYGCSASTYSCTWDSEFSTCGGTDTNCTSYTDENTCISEHFTSCSGTYDTGECSGTLNPGVCSGDFDDVAPTLVSAIADYETVVLTYNESLDESTNVSTEVYVLNVNNTQTGIDLVTVSGSTVILNLSQSVGAGSSITLHYTAGMSPIQDTSGNQAESFSSQEVVNDTAYTLSGISPSSGSVINSITTNSDVEYTINRSALTSGTITITRTGGSIDNGSPHVCNMMNTALSAGTHDNFDFSDLSNGCQYAIGDLVDQAVYTFVFEGIDNQSNVVEPITITDVVFDNTAPVAPSIPDLDAQSDSGYSSTDNITNDTTPTFDISCENGATVTLREIDSISTWGTGTCSGGTVSITSGQLSEGSHNLYARQVDSAGNVSEDGSLLTITIDITPPNTAGVPTATFVGPITSDNTPTFNVSCDENGSVIEILSGPSVIGSAVCDGSSAIVTSSVLLDDSYTIRARQTDVAGNISISDSESVPFTVDTAGPSITSIASTTTSTIATITWTTNEAATSTVDYGTTSGYGTASSSSTATTSHSYTLTGLTPATLYHFRISAWDALGNLTQSSDMTFMTASIPSVAPTITAQSASSVSTTTATLNGTITSDGFASTTVRGFRYGTTISYTATSSTSGTYGVGAFSQNITGLTCETTYHYQAFTQNTAGVASSSDATFTTDTCPGVPTPPPSTPDTTPTPTSGPTGGGGGYVPFYTTNTPLVVSSSPTGNTPTKVVSSTGTLPRAVFTTTNGTPYTFNRNLTPFTTISADARILQTFLNSIGYTVSTTGAGAPGKETNRFGPATRAALARFQRSVGIAPAVGYFGPVTRAYINDLIKKLIGRQ